VSLAALGGLVLLALVDSTSFGTLGIPVLLLIQRQVVARAVLLYLAVIGGFYFLVGLALLAGAGVVVDAVGGVLDHPVVAWIQLGVGVALFAVSFLLDRRGRAWRARRRAAKGLPEKESRRERWLARIAGPTPAAGAVAGVALAAGLVEVASMLPYLGAIGLISTSPLGAAQQVGVLAAYVLVMTLPALVLLALRLAAHRLVAPLLARAHRFIERNADEMLGWAVGIVGFLLAYDALGRLAAVGIDLTG